MAEVPASHTEVKKIFSKFYIIIICHSTYPLVVSGTYDTTTD